MPTGTADGIVDYAGNGKLTPYVAGESETGNGDQGQSYSYASAAYGDWVYINTMYGGVGAAANLISSMDGLTTEAAKAIVNTMYNGQLFISEPDGVGAGGMLFKFNVKTGETKILMSRSTNGVIPTFRSAIEMNGKLYFVGMIIDLNSNELTEDEIKNAIAHQNGFPCIYEVDPQNDDRLTCVYDCVDIEGFRKLVSENVFTSTRAIGTYKDAMIAGCLDTDGVFLTASENPSDGKDSFTVIADMSDLFNYPAYHRSDVNAGGGIYQVIEYNGALYVVICTGTKDSRNEYGTLQTFAIVKGTCNGNVTDRAAWTWSVLAGDQEKDGAKYPFGLDTERVSAGACTLQVYNDYLYIGEYNDVASALLGFVYGKDFTTQATNLEQSINLYRMDKDENIEKVVGDPTEAFPESLTGLGSGYTAASGSDEKLGTHMNQYTWQTTVYNGKLYVGTMDTTTLLEPITKLTNGDILNMTEDEWKSQLNYIRVLIELLLEDNSSQMTRNAISLAAEAYEDDTDAAALVQDAIVAAQDRADAYEAGNYAMEASDNAVENSGQSEHTRITLSDEQIEKLVSGLLSGDIVKGSLSDGLDWEFAQINSALSMISDLIETTEIEEFTEVYKEIQQELSSIEEQMPENLKSLYNLLVSYSTKDNLVGLAKSLKYFETAEAGFDLFEITDNKEAGVTVSKVTTDGFGDRYNHGLRIFEKTSDYWVIGTANPFNGTQLWRTANIEPKSEPVDPEPVNPEPEPEPVNPDPAPVEPDQEPYMEVTKDVVQVNYNNVMSSDKVKENIFNAVVTDTNLTKSNVTIEYLARESSWFWDEVWAVPRQDLSEYWWTHDFGTQDTETIRITYTGTDKYPTTIQKKAKIKVADLRSETTLTINDGIKMKYQSKDMMDAVIKVLIAQNATVTNKDGEEIAVTADDFSYTPSTDSWSAGDQEITVTYNGTAEEYKASSVTITIHIEKGDASVSVNSQNITYGETFDNIFSSDPADAKPVGLIAGIDKNGKTFVGLDASNMLGSIHEILPETMTVKELVSLLTTYKGEDSDIVGTVNKIIDMLKQIYPDIEEYPISFRNPTEAGVYIAVGVTTSENYNTAFGVGYLTIAPDKTEPIFKDGLTFKTELPDKKRLSLEEAATFDFSAALLPEATISPDDVRTLYMGITANGDFISGAEPIRDEAGVYVELAYVLDEDYIVKPIFRAYAIGRETTKIQMSESVITTYDGNAHGLTATVVDESGNLIEDADVEFRYIGTEADGTYYDCNEAPVNAGIYWVVATYTGNTRYTPSVSMRGTIVIKRSDAHVVFKVGDITTVYGDTFDVKSYDGYSWEGLADRDVQAIRETMYCDEADDVSVYTIMVHIPESIAKNYKNVIEVQAGKHTIAAREVTITIDNKQKTEGQQDPELTYTVNGNGLIGGDSLNIKLTREAGEDVGFYDIYVDTSDMNPNYVLKVEPDGADKFEIVKAAENPDIKPAPDKKDDEPADNNKEQEETSDKETPDDNNKDQEETPEDNKEQEKIPDKETSEDNKNQEETSDKETPDDNKEQEKIPDKETPEDDKNQEETPDKELTYDDSKVQDNSTYAASENEGKNTVKTGDTLYVSRYLAAMLIALAGVMVITFRRDRRI